MAMEELLEGLANNAWCATNISDVVKCHVINNNINEIFNGVILKALSKPNISMLEEIRSYMMQKMIVKRDHVRKCNVDFGPNIIAKLEVERSNSTKW